MKGRFTKCAMLVIKYARDAAKNLGLNYVGSEHILIGLAEVEAGMASKILENSNITPIQVYELVKQFSRPIRSDEVSEDGEFSPMAKKIIERAYDEAKKFNADSVGTEHILISLMKETECSGTRILITMDANLQKMFAETVAAMGENVEKYRDEMPMFRNARQRDRMFMLEQYGRDLTKLAADGGLDPIYGREDEIKRIIQILSRRTKNNPCLVGEPGVGKTAIVEALATRIVDGEVPVNMLGKRVVTLDLSAMVAGSKYRGEFEERIKRIINEVSNNKNVILFIDEIHTIIGAGGAEGAIDASNILKPALARGEMQVIGATTITEFRKYFEKDAALERRFQPVAVEETTIEETVMALKSLRSRYEEHHNVTIEDGAIEAAVKLSERYINDRNLPDKAIDLMDEAAAKAGLEAAAIPEEIARLRKELSALDEQKEAMIEKEEFGRVGNLLEMQNTIKRKEKNLLARWEKDKKARKIIVTENDIADVVAKWTKIPVKKITGEESARLKKLEKMLHERVVGQDEAVSSVSKAVRRGRVGLKDPKRPTGSFLFLGPTGVGKTELSKALAEAVFGSENAIIRVDMSEYMEQHSVSKMIGSPPGYVGFDDGGQLSEKVRRNPYSVILFDEIEKAHPDVFNILLQVLDDGHITDSQGRRVDFKNTIIIMTSNAGASRIVEPKRLGFVSGEDEKADYEIMKKNVMEEVKKLFKPEFLNRIDEIIVFHALTKEDNVKIAGIMLNGIIKRIGERMNIELTVTSRAKKNIVDESFDKKYGARPLRRAIQNMVEDKLAEEILSGNIKKGDKVTLSANGKKLNFTVDK